MGFIFQDQNDFDAKIRMVSYPDSECAAMESKTMCVINLLRISFIKSSKRRRCVMVQGEYGHRYPGGHSIIDREYTIDDSVVRPNKKKASKTRKKKKGPSNRYTYEQLQTAIAKKQAYRDSYKYRNKEYVDIGKQETAEISTRSKS